MLKNNSIIKQEWTIGRGIAYGLKWIAIMGMVIALFSFAQFLMKFYRGYYDVPERCVYQAPEATRIVVENTSYNDNYIKENYNCSDNKCLLNEEY